MCQEPLKISVLSEYIFILSECSQDKAEPCQWKVMCLWQEFTWNYDTESNSDENWTPSPVFEEL